MCHCLPESGRAKPVPSQWINDDGRLAHPDSPQGRGGPGKFRSAGVFGAGYSDDMLPSADAPTASTVDPALLALADGEVVKKGMRQPAPTVTADAADEVVHKVLTLKLMADQSGVAGITGAKTNHGWTLQGQITDQRQPGKKGKIVSFENGLSWTIQVRTRYGSGKPDSDSAYGRGTTVADVQAGSVTLGFHESCHRANMLDYFRTTAPPAFDGAVGDLAVDFDAKVSKFTAAMEAYFRALKPLDLAALDEVGNPTLTQYEASPG